MLLQTVQRELRLIVDKYFKRLQIHIRTTLKRRRLDTYVGHKLLAGDPDVLGESGREHHDLLVVRRCPEDLLNVASHV